MQCDLSDRLLLIRTGGTIDAEPYDDPRRPPEYVSVLKTADSLVMPTVAQFPNHEKVDGFSWGSWDENCFIKDSKLFTESDIDALAQIIRNDDHGAFVITHGTDAMVKNAQSLKEKLAGSGKIVALAGAMVPLSMRERFGSDGVDALRYALENIARQAPGVYVAGRSSASETLGFFDPQTVEKDREGSLAHLRFTLKPSSPQR